MAASVPRDSKRPVVCPRGAGEQSTMSWRDGTQSGFAQQPHVEPQTQKVEFSMAEKKAGKESTKRAAKPAAKKADGEAEVLGNIAAMSEPDRAIGERLHAIIKANAPALSSRLWYGMPAYAKDGKVVCVFQSAQKFKTRYATLGFQHEAKLDEGRMWPVAFALTGVTAAEEARITALVQKAVG
jgi:hypothetical protein